MNEDKDKKAAGGYLLLAGILAASLFYVAAGVGIAGAVVLAGIVYWRWRLVPRQGWKGAGYFCAALLAGALGGAVLGFGIAALRARSFHIQADQGAAAAILSVTTLLGLAAGAIAGIRRIWQPTSQPGPRKDENTPSDG